MWKDGKMITTEASITVILNCNINIEKLVSLLTGLGMEFCDKVIAYRMWGHGFNPWLHKHIYIVSQPKKLENYNNDSLFGLFLQMMTSLSEFYSVNASYIFYIRPMASTILW